MEKMTTTQRRGVLTCGALLADVSPFHGLQKNNVLRECRIFSEAQLNVVKCTQVLTKVLYLLNQGEIFSNEEAVDVFFSVTKLFQSQDVSAATLFM
jgi:coatomer protein complex subunit gamma